MASRYLTSVMFVGCLVVSGAAQPACSKVEIPVSVVNATLDTFRGLAAEDFAAQPQKGRIDIKSATFDDGPRRMLVVVDTSKKLPANARAAEVELIKAMVAASRPEDSLALITARGPGGIVKFGEDRNWLIEAISPEGKANRGSEGVLDAVMDGMEWFDGSRPGDAIVLIAADLEGNHKANPKTVAKALADRHLRMFGLALGPVTATSTVASHMVTHTLSQGMAEATPDTGTLIYETGDLNFYPLTTNSGGLLLSVINGNRDSSFSMDDPKQQQRVRQKGRQVVGMVNTFYRLQIDQPQFSRPEAWTLDVKEAIRKHAPAMWILYPRELGPC